VVVAFVALLLDVAFTSAMTEDAHGSAAIVRTYHNCCELRQLLARALLHQLRSFFRLSELEWSIARILAKIARLMRRRPQSFRGRQFFFQQTVLDAVDNEQNNDVDGIDLAQSCMIQHADLYAELPRATRDEYDMQAKRVADMLSARIGEETQHLRVRLALKRREIKLAADAGSPIALSSARFTDSEVREVAAAAASRGFTGSALRVLIDTRTTSPSEPELALQKAIIKCETVGVQFPVPETYPWWVPIVVRYQDRFARSIFFLEEGGAQKAFLFLYAREQPYTCVFCRLFQAARYMLPHPAIVGQEQFEVALADHWVHQFVLGQYRFVTHQGVSKASDPNISIVSPAHYLKHRYVSNLQPVPFYIFIRGFYDLRGNLRH
jgi:hypothetical protein